MFTWFTDETAEDVMSYMPENCYWIFQFENCPDTGNRHAQGYMHWKNAKKLDQVKKVFSVKTHWEVRRGNHEEAKAYCMKEESRIDGPYEGGLEFEPAQGKRSDLEEVIDMIKSGSKLSEIVDECTSQFIKYPRGIERAHQILGLKNHMEKRDLEPPEVHVRWGDVGVGKSAFVWEKEKDLYTVPIGSKWDKIWWDGYDGEEAVLFDDFEFYKDHLNPILRWTDRYPAQVPFKGGHAPMVAKRFYFTGNLEPSKWWEGASERQKNAFLRRVTSNTEVTGNTGAVTKSEEKMKRGVAVGE